MSAPRATKKRHRGEEPPHDATKPTVNDIARANKIVVAGRNPNQIAYLQSIKQNEITFGLGPAGTGKTFLATAAACGMLLHGKVKRFIISRPAVAACGEEHGFLPGDLRKKLAPWARPVIDIAVKFLGPARVDAMLRDGLIETMPFTYMRGLTFDDAFVLLDEAQNTLVEQMKMFTTRLGEGVRVVICGDISQSDLKSGTANGLSAVMELVREFEIPAGLVEFDFEDIERSEMARRFAAAWEGVYL